MVTRSIRKQTIPTGVILYTSGAVPPSCWINECTTYDRLSKSVLNACTNAGTNTGAATHSEDSQEGAHTHPAATPFSHNHPYTTPMMSASGGTPGQTKPFGTGPPSVTVNNPTPHKHSVGSLAYSSTTSPIPISPGGSSHTHSATDFQPPFKTIRRMRKSNVSLSFRKTHIPKCLSVLWSKANTLISSCYTFNSSHQDKFLKTIASACASTDATGGSCSHSHPSASSHSHTVTQSAHTHTLSGTSGAPDTTPLSGNPGSKPATQDQFAISSPLCHTHTAPATARNSLCLTTTTSSSGSHSPDSLSHVPQFVTMSMIKKTSHSFRRKAIDSGAVLEWLLPNACIPAGYRLSDGVCGTVNLLDKYVKIVVNSSGTPGGTGGTSSHQHGSSAGHSHTVSHKVTGSPLSPTPHSINQIGCSAPVLALPRLTGPGAPAHGHTTPVASPSSYPFGTGSSHQHGSTSNIPTTRTVAYIQRL